MSMDNTSEARLAQVWPGLADKVRQMAETLAAEFPVKVSAGLRDWPTQHAAWQQGRNPDGTFIDPIHHKGVVTNADAGHSWHNYGLAVDCEPLEKDGSIDWNADHPQWKRMEQVGISLGLTSGATWVRLVDAPHFQITGQWPEGAPTAEVRQLYADGGLEAVWAALQTDVLAGS